MIKKLQQLFVLIVIVLSSLILSLQAQASFLKKASGETVKPLPSHLELEEGDFVSNESRSPITIEIEGTEVVLEPQSSFRVSRRIENNKESLVLKLDRGEVTTQRLSAPQSQTRSLIVASDLGEIQAGDKLGQQLSFSVNASNNTTSVRVFSGSTDLKVSGGERISLNPGGQVLLSSESNVRTPAAPQAQVSLGSAQPSYVSRPPVNTSLPQLGSSQLNFESGYRLPPQMSIQTPLPRIQVPALPPQAGKGRIRARISMD